MNWFLYDWDLRHERVKIRKQHFHYISRKTAHEKCPNTELFLDRIPAFRLNLLRKSPYLVRIQENTDQN